MATKNYKNKSNTKPKAEVVETEEITVPVKETKSYPVVLATKNYYIINKDGNNVRIDKANNLKIGSRAEF